MSDDDACPICLEAGGGGDWTRTRCSHWFHGACLAKLRDDACPMCRGTLSDPEFKTEAAALGAISLDTDYFEWRWEDDDHAYAAPFGGVATYSFAASPYSTEPSGSVNFSRMDTATLRLSMLTPPSTNLMRISMGMAGLRYAN